MTGAKAMPCQRASDADTRCRICGGVSRHWLTKGGRTFRRCGTCRFTFIPEGVPEVAPGVTIYEAEENVFVQEGNQDYYLDDAHLASFGEKLDFVRAFVPGGRLLDAGANYGHFLKMAAGSFEARGFDISPQAVRWSVEHFGVSNWVGSIYDPPAGLRGTYDAVTCWDVVEHIPDARQALRVLHGQLKPGGFLFLSTPDTGSLLSRLMGRFWHYLDPVQHIALFSRRNLACELEKEGFEVVKFRSFGHYYRLRYVFARLLQLHPRGPLSWGVKAGKWCLSILLSRKIYIRLGDVMGVAARKRSTGPRT